MQNLDDRLVQATKATVIDLKPGQTLVWQLDYNQYRLITRPKVEELMAAIKGGLQRLYPDNTILVTMGQVELSVIDPQPHIDETV